MEKIKNVFSCLRSNLSKIRERLILKVKSFFTKKASAETSKTDLNSKNIIALFFTLVVLFVVITLFMPTKSEVVFREIAKDPPAKPPQASESEGNQSETRPTASKIWSSSAGVRETRQQASQINHNTSMLVTPHGGNSHLELQAGTHFRIRIMDKFTASQEAVPVMAKLIEEVTTQSGLSLPEDSLLYGEASYHRQSGRAQISFRQISYPSGQTRSISAYVVSPDGMKGLEGNVHSDAAQNTMGQVITTFVGGLASGSMQTDVLGASQGGVTNGLLQAVSDTAKDRAQKYGESLKEPREWIEVSSGIECEAVLQQPLKMVESEVNQ